MSVALVEKIRSAFKPPRYLALPFAGIDLSTSSVKAVRVEKKSQGYILASYAIERLPAGAFTDGEIVDKAEAAKALLAAGKAVGIHNGNIAVSESKSYLFETSSPGRTKGEWRTTVEQHLDELVPLPPSEALFDVVSIGLSETGDTRLTGVGVAARIVNEMLDVYDAAHLAPTAIEGEFFAIARSLLPFGDTSTTLILDIGKTTTKLGIVSNRIPLFATTIGIGGHALTLAVQKHFGVTEAEARRVKAERGIVPAPGNEDYLAAMLSTISAIRDEIQKRLEYWNEKVALSKKYEAVSRVIIAGGNASVRGLPEYLEGALHVPVATGDVFTNFASREYWLPPIPYTESLAYATAIGLALRDGE